MEDGIFHYMGRNDFQVKISGVRIECEEAGSYGGEHSELHILGSCSDRHFLRFCISVMMV